MKFLFQLGERPLDLSNRNQLSDKHFLADYTDKS